MGFSTSRPSALLASHNRGNWCTDELGGRAPIQLASHGSNALRRRCGNKFSVDAQKQCAARQCAGANWHGKLCCALGLHSSWTRSRPLRSAHSCTARSPLLPSLNMCCVCAVCDRRLLLLLLWSQDRRENTARRCGSLLYIGLHHVQQFVALRGAADECAAWIPLDCRGTAVATVARSCSAGLLRPAEHGLFASGGDRAIGIDVPTV